MPVRMSTLLAKMAALPGAGSMSTLSVPVRMSTVLAKMAALPGAGSLSTPLAKVPELPEFASRNF
jgi:hypothetical protein